MNDGTPIQELVAVPTENALQIFTQEGAIEPYLAMVRKHIDAFVPDMSTADGRKDIKAFAYKVTRSKTALDAAGKKIVDELKALPKKVDETRKHVRDTLDAWAEAIRKPVEDFEAAEEARVANHAARISLIAEKATLPNGISAADIGQRMNFVCSIALSEDACEEFLEEYSRAVDMAINVLTRAHAAAVQYEADQAELAKLREERAEREAKDRAEADAKAQREREAQIEAEAIEKAKRESEEATARERQQAEETLRQAEAARIAAEERAAAAIEQARQQAADTEARIAREAAEKAQQAEDERKARERDTEHKAAINRKAVAALIEGGISEDIARAVIVLIARKQIPNVNINY